MILLKEYETKDWSEITDAIEPFVPPMPMERFVRMAEDGVAVTGIEKGSVMACGGIIYLDDTNGVVWLKMSRKCLKQSYRWARSIKETFGIMMASVGDLKISTYILDNFCKGEKLAGIIGLKRTDKTEEYNGNIYHKYTAVI